MKKLILAFFILQISLHAQFHTVEFQVNMGVQIFREHFNPATQQVFIAGTFNGWDPYSTQMFDFDGDSIYTLVVAGFLEGSLIEFKFIYGDQIWEIVPNRQYLIPNNNSTYYAFFNNDSLYTFTAITFKFTCDMTNEINNNNFNPSTDTLNLRSNFWGWFNKDFMLLPSIVNPNEYEIQMSYNSIAGEELLFKYAYLTSSGITWESGPNKIYTITPADTISKFLHFQSVFNDSNYSVPVELTSFAASVIDNSIILNWETATELTKALKLKERVMLNSKS